MIMITYNKYTNDNNNVYDNNYDNNDNYHSI